MPSITARVRRVGKVLKTDTQYDWKTEGGDAVTDILAGLHHVCDAWGFDFAECDQVAYRHYIHEVTSCTHAKKAKKS